MSYLVAAAVLLIIVGIFTLDLIKIGIGIVVIVIVFSVFRLKNRRATKDPILFELLVSITNLTQEIDKELYKKEINLYSDRKYNLILSLFYIGFVKEAADIKQLPYDKYKDLFYSSFNSITYNYKKNEIESLFLIGVNIKSYPISSKIVNEGARIFRKRITNNGDYL